MCKGTFITGNYLLEPTETSPKKVVSATPKVGKKIYFRKDNFFCHVLQTKEKSNETCYNAFHIFGAYDVAHRKDDNKSVPAIADSFNKHMTGIDKS